jgi:hypothetical protein
MVVHATGVTNVTSGTIYPVQSSGNSQPGNNFKFDPVAVSFSFNVKTNGLAAGSYTLDFIVDAGATLKAPFEIK